MIDLTWLMLCLLALCSAVAFVNWRQAILLTIFLDALRDPIRKLTPEQPVWMSQAIVLVWFIILLNCLSQDSRILQSIRRTFPRTNAGTTFLLAALLPGAALSLVLYRNGWILVILGALSYLGPFAGLLIGTAFAKRVKDTYKFMQLYVLANSIVLIGNLAEHFSWGWPGLGGLLGFEWIRHMPGVLVRLVSGFFRSPDVAGFHAAHVVVFSVLLALPRIRGSASRLYWLVPAFFGLYTLFLSGRRKMFSIPVVFLLVLVLVDILRRQKGSKNLILFLGVFLLSLTGGTFYFIQDDSELADHQTYLATTIYDIVPKLYENVFEGSLVTIQQSGFMGSGLGVATQGAQYAGVDRTKVWQEDGVSRLFKELGVIGVVLLIFSGIQFFREFLRASSFPIHDSARVILQNAGIAIFAANAACFAISHQHVSGDAANGILPLLFLGGVFGHILGEQKNAQRQPPALNSNPILVPKLVRRQP